MDNYYVRKRAYDHLQDYIDEGYPYDEAVIQIKNIYGIWLDSNVERRVLLRQRELILKREEEAARKEAEEKKKTALVEAKDQAAVMEAKKYILMKAEQKEVEFLTQRELDSILENPPLYDIEEFLSPADVLKGLGNQMLWTKGQAMLAKIEIQVPKPKEKSWTLPQD